MSICPETAAEPKHDPEVVRIVSKMARTRRLAVGGGLAMSGLGLVILYVTAGVEGMLLNGSILCTSLLVSLLVMVLLQLKTQNRLKATLGTRPPIAFHLPDGSYFFISPEGVFMEKTLGFVPWQGFSHVTDLGFDADTHKLTIRIQNGRQSHNWSEVSIAVPRDFPAEPFERLIKAFRDGDGQRGPVG